MLTYSYKKKKKRLVGSKKHCFFFPKSICFLPLLWTGGIPCIQKRDSTSQEERLRAETPSSDRGEEVASRGEARKQWGPPSGRRLPASACPGTPGLWHPKVEDPAPM